MKTLAYIQDNYLAIDFFLSMSCNKNCHYCTSYTLEMRNLTVDMDFLREVLGYLKQYKIRASDIKLTVEKVLGIEIMTENIKF